MSAVAAPDKLVIRHSTSTAPQMKFWTSRTKFRLFVGGLGSGKTRAGAVECLRMPARTMGAVIAPTYPMLRDATLRTFLALADKAKIISRFNKAEMSATLIDGKEIIFRSADNPNRLRGPNLGWYWIDEGAMMDEEAWLIMLGRLRELPARAWVTTTPNGFNWVYHTFRDGGPSYEVITSSTRENRYLAPDFVKVLESAYTSDWRKQEIEGEFIDPSGALFKRQWFERSIEKAPEGMRWVRYWDLAASTKTTADFTASAAVALGSDGTLYIRDLIHGRWEWPDAKKIIIQTMLNEPSTEHGIEEALHGLAAVQELRREPSVAHIALRGIVVEKDKVSRALPWAARAEAGKVLLVRGQWASTFLDEVCSFPLGEHDDIIDAVSGGLQMLARRKVLTVI